jgi:hypothetical protein
MASEPTSAGRCGLKLQLIWHRVDTHPAPYFELEFVCGVPGIQGAKTFFPPNCYKLVCSPPLALFPYLYGCKT